MATYRIKGEEFRGDDPALGAALARVYDAKARPVCLCVPTGVEMYIARVAGQFILKRMPSTGSEHSPSCDSYEPPAELSGLGQVLGSAIQEDPNAGVTELKLDFALSKSPGRAPSPATGAGDGGSVRTDGQKLTLRGLLHYLWDQAGLSKWTPAMTAKRSWQVVREYLFKAAADKVAKGASMADQIYIPETFAVEHKDALVERRQAILSGLAGAPKGTRRLMMLVAEVKEVKPARYGQKLVAKHLPDFSFMLNDDLGRRIAKRFANDIELWEAMEDSHLVVAGTFGVSPTGIATMEEVCLMIVTANWIPFENAYEKSLLDILTTLRRPFTKGLRYNLPSNSALASVMLADTAPTPTAMYVMPPGSTNEYIEATDALIAESALQPWLWAVADGSMPDLPPSVAGNSP
jgi:hypothetical protein